MATISQEKNQDRLYRYAEMLGFGDVHIKLDQASGLTAIIAIHSTKRGPALGGCRMVAYGSMDLAIEDALRLAQMMSYKAALSNLAHGGGKAVLIRPKLIKDREAYFSAFGNFVEELGGRYITAVDSGTSPTEMDIIARQTQYVTCTSSDNIGDPAPFTALGVRRGIEAAVRFKLGRQNLEGIHVAIQGAGNVGYCLAKDLLRLGARVTMCDVNAEVLQRSINELKIATCAPDEIFDIAADVFAPCALGAVLNQETIPRLKVNIVAGAANNQLARRRYGIDLLERGILYAPDFVLNAGGVIQAATLYAQGDAAKAKSQIENIYDTTYSIFERAAEENRATSEIVEQMAIERL